TPRCFPPTTGCPPMTARAVRARAVASPAAGRQAASPAVASRAGDRAAARGLAGAPRVPARADPAPAAVGAGAGPEASAGVERERIPVAQRGEAFAVRRQFGG